VNKNEISNNIKLSILKEIIISLLLITILSSCNKNDAVLDTQEFVPGEVSVGIKSGTSIKEIFKFINRFNHKVDNINSLSFTSDLPSDSLQFVLDFLNKKEYTNDGKNWFVTGYLNYKTKQIHISPRLFDMDNLDYQNDWITSMQKLKLSKDHNIELNSGIIYFNVPIGLELGWKNIFKTYRIVDWAELNYIYSIEILETN